MHQFLCSSQQHRKVSARLISFLGWNGWAWRDWTFHHNETIYKQGPLPYWLTVLGGLCEAGTSISQGGGEPSFLFFFLIGAQFSSVTQLCPTLRPNEQQHTRPPCPSPTPRVHLNPCPLSGWCHPIISSSAIPFSSCLQSFPASGPCQMSQIFTSGGQSIGASASASVLPMNTQDWFPLGWTSWISL